MSSLPPKYLLITTLVALFSLRLVAGDGFPLWDNANLLQQDLKRATLVNNLPNITEADHYIGVQYSSSLFHSNSGESHLLPGARVSVYPNPGYNVWAQFAQWPGSEPNFAVGTGIQVELASENPTRRQAMGISWNEIYGDGYIQRDISVHGLYGFASEKLNLGLMAIIDLQHLVIDNDRGVPDYNGTILLAVPYISWLWKEQLRISMMMPYNSTGPAVVLSGEFLLGKRE
jgi:hypothetical protein